MTNETKSLLKKCLVGGIILTLAATIISVAAFVGIITDKVANILNPIIIAGTVAYFVLFLPQKRKKNDSANK